MSRQTLTEEQLREVQNDATVAMVPDPLNDQLLVWLLFHTSLRRMLVILFSTWSSVAKDANVADAFLAASLKEKGEMWKTAVNSLYEKDDLGTDAGLVDRMHTIVSNVMRNMDESVVFDTPDEKNIVTTAIRAINPMVPSKKIRAIAAFLVTVSSSSDDDILIIYSMAMEYAVRIYRMLVMYMMTPVPGMDAQTRSAQLNTLAQASLFDTLYGFEGGDSSTLLSNFENTALAPKTATVVNAFQITWSQARLSGMGVPDVAAALLEDMYSVYATLQTKTEKEKITQASAAAALARKWIDIVLRPSIKGKRLDIFSRAVRDIGLTDEFMYTDTHSGGKLPMDLDAVTSFYLNKAQDTLARFAVDQAFMAKIPTTSPWRSGTPPRMVLETRETLLDRTLLVDLESALFDGPTLLTDVETVAKRLATVWVRRAGGDDAIPRSVIQDLTASASHVSLPAVLAESQVKDVMEDDGELVQVVVDLRGERLLPRTIPQSVSRVGQEKYFVQNGGELREEMYRAYISTALRELPEISTAGWVPSLLFAGKVAVQRPQKQLLSEEFTLTVDWAPPASDAQAMAEFEEFWKRAKLTMFWACVASHPRTRAKFLQHVEARMSTPMTVRALYGTPSADYTWTTDADVAHVCAEDISEITQFDGILLTLEMRPTSTWDEAFDAVHAALAQANLKCTLAVFMATVVMDSPVGSFETKTKNVLTSIMPDVFGSELVFFLRRKSRLSIITEGGTPVDMENEFSVASALSETAHPTVGVLVAEANRAEEGISGVPSKRKFLIEPLAWVKRDDKAADSTVSDITVAAIKELYTSLGVDEQTRRLPDDQFAQACLHHKLSDVMLPEAQAAHQTFVPNDLYMRALAMLLVNAHSRMTLNDMVALIKDGGAKRMEVADLRQKESVTVMRLIQASVASTNDERAMLSSDALAQKFWYKAFPPSSAYSVAAVSSEQAFVDWIADSLTNKEGGGAVYCLLAASGRVTVDMLTRVNVFLKANLSDGPRGISSDALSVSVEQTVSSQMTSSSKRLSRLRSALVLACTVGYAVGLATLRRYNAIRDSVMSSKYAIQVAPLNETPRRRRYKQARDTQATARFLDELLIAARSSRSMFPSSTVGGETGLSEQGTYLDFVGDVYGTNFEDEVAVQTLPSVHFSASVPSTVNSHRSSGLGGPSGNAGSGTHHFGLGGGSLQPVQISPIPAPSRPTASDGKLVSVRSIVQRKHYPKTKTENDVKLVRLAIFQLRNYTTLLNKMATHTVDQCTQATKGSHVEFTKLRYNSSLAEMKRVPLLVTDTACSSVYTRYKYDLPQDVRDALIDLTVEYYATSQSGDALPIYTLQDLDPMRADPRLEKLRKQ